MIWLKLIICHNHYQVLKFNSIGKFIGSIVFLRQPTLPLNYAIDIKNVLREQKNDNPIPTF